MTKVMGFDFNIHYKEGRLNVVADALSRCTKSDLLILLLSNIVADFHELIKQSYS